MSNYDDHDDHTATYGTPADAYTDEGITTGDDEPGDDEPGYNELAISLDSAAVSYAAVRGDEYGTSQYARKAQQAHSELLGILASPAEIDRVQVSFPDAENGEQTEADERAPLGWCNSAAITLDREDDAITVSISVGDPRGAFAFTVRRLKDGSLIMHTPYPGEPFEHMPLTQLRPGTYQIG